MQKLKKESVGQSDSILVGRLALQRGSLGTILAPQRSSSTARIVSEFPCADPGLFPEHCEVWAKRSELKCEDVEKIVPTAFS